MDLNFDKAVSLMKNCKGRVVVRGPLQVRFVRQRNFCNNVFCRYSDCIVVIMLSYLDETGRNKKNSSCF
ncbi:hypothetical protein ATZ36_15680 [Candidatus Endomicrobiellum trichonymphae]|uniref:Uncharacterized protein n=1 Tax=Endomicrobium trichonymphae TaxID=1408204 RepID=A0A1E5IL66_ENDTX|nr:hypothetical protein ATZ36_15680 [Candidatus Endomicrobium trichonymphae]